MVIPPFRNEPPTDFTRPEHRQAFQEALARVHARFGTRYPLRIGREAVTTGETLASHNPAHPDEVVGVHAMAGVAEVDAAVSAATAAFADWSRTPAEERAAILLRAAQVVRVRRHELSALMVGEVGKPWDEADGETSEVIDFMEWYARGMLRLAGEENAGAAFWQSSRRSPDAPRGIETSGITQPPIHARVALEMHRHARDRESSTAFLAWLYPRLAAQHAYLGRERDPTRIGLASIVHPWESGLDNSPVWDRDLAELEVPPGAIPPYQRHDLLHANPADRPTNETYDRFVYLATRYRDSGYDDRLLTDTVPFTVADPLFNAIYLWSTHALAELAEIVGADPQPHREAADRIHEALLRHLWDPLEGRFAAVDVRTMERGVEDTIVAFAPLLDPELPAHLRAAIVTTMKSTCFHAAGPGAFVVPSFDLLSADFDRRRYWRGPIWINTNWLLWSGLHQHGYDSETDDIVLSSIRLVEQSGFREYFDPIDGTGHGSDGFGWTAALTLDLIERHRGPSRTRLIERLI